MSRILGADDGVETAAQCECFRIIAIAGVTAAKTPGAAAREIPEPDIRQSDPGEGVEEIQLLERRKIALDHPVGHRSVFAPLDVDFNLPATAPVRVQQRPMPKGPDVG